MPSPTHQRGITLVEAAAVIAIVAVTASAAAPGLQRLIERYRLEAAATRFAADLQLARNESIARNRVVRLSWHAASACYLLHTGPADACSCDAAGAAQCAPGQMPIRAMAWDGGMRVSLQSNTASIAFDPLHGTVTPTATWRISAADGRAIHHVVNVMGRVRSCSPLATVPGYRAC
ncbi:MAG: GspH/FimT family protein [Piscinibacter sp.]